MFVNMRWRIPLLGAMAGWLLTAAWVSGQPPADDTVSTSPVSKWPTERVEMRDGSEPREGLIESESDDWLYLTEIRRPPGGSLYLVVHPIDRKEIARIVRLPEPQRAVLRRIIQQFIDRTRIEAARMDAVALESISIDGTSYRRYQGEWFALDSTASEPITRQVVVRAEQIFTAYRQILPPRTSPRRPLRVMLFGSLSQYDGYLRQLGVRVENRACFVRSENVVVIGSQLAQYTAELEEIRAHHARVRTELDQLEKRLAEQLAKIRRMNIEGAPRLVLATLTLDTRRTRKLLADKQTELDRCDRQNDRTMEKAVRQVLARLYHELFHAYRENHIYPESSHDVPPWLDEGLAMIFEGGQLEWGSGSLRIGVADRTMLGAVRLDLHHGRALPLGQLLVAGKRQFLVAPGASAETSIRTYRYAWALAYYLSFDRKLLESPALEQYVARQPSGTDPLRRFEQLVGMPLAKFEKAWHAYLRQLP